MSTFSKINSSAAVLAATSIFVHPDTKLHVDAQSILIPLGLDPVWRRANDITMAPEHHRQAHKDRDFFHKKKNITHEKLVQTLFDEKGEEYNRMFKNDNPNIKCLKTIKYWNNAIYFMICIQITHFVSQSPVFLFLLVPLGHRFRAAVFFFSAPLFLV